MLALVCARNRNKLDLHILRETQLLSSRNNPLLLLLREVEDRKCLGNSLGRLLDECECVEVLFMETAVVAVDENVVVLAAEVDHFAPEGEDAVGVVELRGDVDLGSVWVSLHPGLLDFLACLLCGLGETTVLQLAVPGDGYTSVITSEVLHGGKSLVDFGLAAVGTFLNHLVEECRIDVEVVFGRVALEGCVYAADFLSLVDVLRTAEAGLHQSKELGAGDAVLGAIVGVATDGACLIVVFHKDGGPCIGAADEALHAVDSSLGVGERPVTRRGFKLVSGAEADIDEVELEHHVELLGIGADVLEDLLHIGGIGQLADGDGAVLGENSVDFAEELVHTRTVAVEQSSGLEFGLGVDDGSIGVGLELAIHVDSVDTETVNTTLEPELNGRIVDGLAADGVLPVQIGLLLGEQVEVVLLGVLIPLPNTAATKVAAPIVGRQALTRLGVFGRLPDVPIALGAVLAGDRLLEPGVLVGGVVDDEVEHYAQVAGMGFFDERLHVLQGAVGAVDVLVVGNVVAHVDLWAVVHGADPDGVDA